MPDAAEGANLRITCLHQCASAHRRRERDQIEECQVLRQVSASTRAVATVCVCGFRAMVVWSTGGTRGTRRHAHRCVCRTHTMHRARRHNKEKTAVGHQTESDQRSQHSSSHGATHHKRKVRLGMRCVQTSRGHLPGAGNGRCQHQPPRRVKERRGPNSRIDITSYLDILGSWP